MYNFNHERWGFVVQVRLAGWRAHAKRPRARRARSLTPAPPPLPLPQANRFARVCFEDAFRYAHRRRTFGKALVEHPVIRWKLAEMARQIESTHAALEALTYQFATMGKAEQNAALAGDCALLKAHSSKVFEARVPGRIERSAAQRSAACNERGSGGGGWLFGGCVSDRPF